MGHGVKFVLGDTNDVLQFDKSRQKCKKWPNNKDYLESYKDSLAIIETRISRQQRKLKEQLQEWEREYFVKNNCKAASYADINANSKGKRIMDQLKYHKLFSRK